MTWGEARKTWPWLPERSDYYVQTPHGGWRHRTANVSGAARVYGLVCARATVGDSATVDEGDTVIGNVYTCGPVGSRNAMLSAYMTADGLRYANGCFAGSREALIEAVAKTNSDWPHGVAYRAAIDALSAIVSAYATAEKEA